AAEAAGQDILELDERDIYAVFRRNEPGYTTGTAARNDGYLMYRVAIRQHVPDKGVAGFVIGSDPLVLLRHDLALTLGPDGFAVLAVRQADIYAAVETAGSQ